MPHRSAAAGQWVALFVAVLLPVSACTTSQNSAPTSTSAVPAGEAAKGSAGSSASSSVAEQQYRNYANARYGFACEVPADFTPGPDPTNGDGRQFTDPSGQVQVTCSGSNNVDELSTADAYAQAQQFAADDGATVSFKSLKEEAYTVSGTDESGRIFYEHTFVGPGSTNTVSWSYPAEQKEALDEAVQHSVETFETGDISVAH